MYQVYYWKCFKIQVNYVLRFGGHHIYLVYQINESSVYTHWVLLCRWVVSIEIEIQKYMGMCMAISLLLCSDLASHSSNKYSCLFYLAYIYYKSILYLVFTV